MSLQYKESTIVHAWFYNSYDKYYWDKLDYCDIGGYYSIYSNREKAKRIASLYYKENGEKYNLISLITKERFPIGISEYYLYLGEVVHISEKWHDKK